MRVPPISDLIIFENENLFIINKPPFVSSLDEREVGGMSIIRLAKQYVPDAQVCHRLDKETSGALIIAKNPATYRFIAMQFEKRQILKTYHAIVEGTHEFNQLSIDLPIINLGKGNVAISKSEGKTALTIFNSLKYYKHYTLVECAPVTGRMHQIRIHLATQRACIAGDDMYGGSPVYLSQMKRKYRLSSHEEELPIIKRFALHAYQVSLHIAEKEQITVTAPYPKDFAILIKLLDKFDTL